MYQFLSDQILALGLPHWAVNVTWALVQGVLVLLFILINALFLIWLERKVAGHIQQRVGPMRVGYHGALQTLADAIKLLSKEDIIPQAADRFVFILAPIIAFASGILVYVVIPWSPNLIVQDLNIALIYIASVTSLLTLALLSAGWSSNNKWSLLGAMRSAAQLVSYEVPLVLSIVSVAVLAGTLSLKGIVEAQQDWGLWFAVLQPIGVFVFLTATIAELNRAPFDMPEAESELVAGYFTEYSGMRWSFFMLAEYGALVASGALNAVLFWGGWLGPVLPPAVWMLIKIYAFVFVAMWIGWSFPRIRVDHLMNLGWKVLLPLAIVQLLATSIIVLVSG